MVGIMINFTRLKDIRLDYAISQAKMAKILNVKRSTYSLWEIGINIIPLNSLCDYADYFNISIDYVLELDNDRNSKNLKKGFDLKVLGNNLKEIRLKHGFTQENIAFILGVTQACIARYEKGDVCISISNLYTFAKYFNISLSEICGKIEEDSLVLN